MSGLTDWERHRLADPEQRLALEDPASRPGWAGRCAGAVCAPTNHSSSPAGFLARVACTRIGSPGIFG